MHCLKMLGFYYLSKKYLKHFRSAEGYATYSAFKDFISCNEHYWILDFNPLYPSVFYNLVFCFCFAVFYYVYCGNDFNYAGCSRTSVASPARITLMEGILMKKIIFVLIMLAIFVIGCQQQAIVTPPAPKSNDSAAAAPQAPYGRSPQTRALLRLPQRRQSLVRHRHDV